MFKRAETDENFLKLKQQVMKHRSTVMIPKRNNSHHNGNPHLRCDREIFAAYKF